MKNLFATLLLASLVICQSCTNSPQNTKTATRTDSAKSNAAIAPATDIKNIPVASAATVLSRKEVPILCYHHIRDWKPNEKASIKEFLIPVDIFKSQIKALADSGYHTISPDQLYAYLNTGAALPAKPVLITFDDTDEDQYTIAAPELAKYGFKGVYFIMTISIGRPRYMTKEQIKDLSDKGNTIAAHTWDHHNVKGYTDADWDKQFNVPKQKLEAIIGKPVDYFAYPFGAWKEEVIPQLKKSGYKAAFQLSTKISQTEPLYTIRRIIVPAWSPAGVIRAMKASFH